MNPIMCTYHILFTNLLIDEHLDRFHILTIVSNAMMNIGLQHYPYPLSFIILTSFLLDEYTEMGFLDH